MSKLAILFPEEQMVRDAEEIVRESRIETAVIKQIRTADTLNEAREAVVKGAKFIVARGYQAQLIRENMNIPVVEVRLTVQEIGLLIKKAIALTGKVHPSIALIVFRNMVPDLSHIEELFDIEFRLFFINRAEEAGEVLKSFTDRRPDCIIGGNVAIRAAQEQGYMTLFYSSTKESVKEAVTDAVNMDLALMQRQQEEAQFETVLDASFNGILRVNQNADIIVVNRFIEHLVGMDNDSMKGKALSAILPQISMDQVRSILSGETEQITTTITIQNDSMMVLMAPIEVEQTITGAIISIRHASELSTINRKAEQDMMMRGFVTRQTFDMIKADSPGRRAVIDLARIYAVSPSPIVVELPDGVSGMALAKAIHNSSSVRIGPFVSLDLGSIPAEQHKDALFRRIDPGSSLEGYRDGIEQGAMLLANNGTLFIRNMEDVSNEIQNEIIRTLSPLSELRTDAQKMNTVSVRLIVSTRKDFRLLLEEGRILPQFFYMLYRLVLKVPPIRTCPEDLVRLFDQSVKEYAKVYHKNLHMTEGGYERLKSFRWDGNDLQVKAFSERLVLTAKKRVVDEIVLDRLYGELYPRIRQIGDEKRYITYRSPEGEEIRSLLRQFSGNRKMVAAQMGISTTTLWRRMKKYGIENAEESEPEI